MKNKPIKKNITTVHMWHCRKCGNIQDKSKDVCENCGEDLLMTGEVIEKEVEEHLSEDQSKEKSERELKKLEEVERKKREEELEKIEKDIQKLEEEEEQRRAQREQEEKRLEEDFEKRKKEFEERRKTLQNSGEASSEEPFIVFDTPKKIDTKPESINEKSAKPDNVVIKKEKNKSNGKEKGKGKALPIIIVIVAAILIIIFVSVITPMFFDHPDDGTPDEGSELESSGLVLGPTRDGGLWDIDGNTYTLTTARMADNDSFNTVILGATKKTITISVNMTIEASRTGRNGLLSFGGDAGFLFGIEDVNGDGKIYENEDNYYLVEITNDGNVGITKNRAGFIGWDASGGLKGSGYNVGDEITFTVTYNYEEHSFVTYVNGKQISSWQDTDDPLTGTGYAIASKQRSGTTMTIVDNPDVACLQGAPVFMSSDRKEYY